MKSGKIKVFYDGLCVLCSSEIETYRKMSGAHNIVFVDITKPDFQAESEELNPFAVHHELHAKDENGKIHIGVDAFILIWKQLDKMQWLSRWARKKPLNQILRVGYQVFVKVRPYLPRKSCEDSPYCPTHTAGPSPKGPHS